MAKSKAPTTKERQHVPLSEDYSPSFPVKQKIGKRKKSQADEDAFVDSKSSRKILKIGQELADEDVAETEAGQPVKPATAFTIESRKDQADPDSDDDVEHVVEEAAWSDDDDQEDDGAEVDPQDLAIFNKFNPGFDPATLLDTEHEQHKDEHTHEEPGRDLASIILAKIEAFDDAADGHAQPRILGGGLPEDAVQLPAKVVEVYEQVGLILSRYKSGKLPKPFKILASVPQWEILLDITRPENWTANATYEATKLFTSSRPAVAQAFLHDMLLPCVREDISETKKLNVHLYKALKKALYKPASFFKGLLFPLVESGTCTLREAQIISSVLARVSVPVLHSAVAIHRLCEVAAEQMSENVEAGGATNIFIRVLLEKKYALPYRVVDALVFHFLRFRTQNTAENGMQGVSGPGASLMTAEKLPVLWHQGLLAFAQRYKNDVTEDQREALLDLLLSKGHKSIGPEVRRELLEGRGRGIPIQAPDDLGGDDTMMDA